MKIDKTEVVNLTSILQITVSTAYHTIGET